MRGLSKKGSSLCFFDCGGCEATWLVSSTAATAAAARRRGWWLAAAPKGPLESGPSARRTSRSARDTAISCPHTLAAALIATSPCVVSASRSSATALRIFSALALVMCTLPVLKSSRYPHQTSRFTGTRTLFSNETSKPSSVASSTIILSFRRRSSGQCAVTRVSSKYIKHAMPSCLRHFFRSCRVIAS